MRKPIKENILQVNAYEKSVRLHIEIWSDLLLLCKKKKKKYSKQVSVGRCTHTQRETYIAFI